MQLFSTVCKPFKVKYTRGCGLKCVPTILERSKALCYKQAADCLTETAYLCICLKLILSVLGLRLPNILIFLSLPWSLYDAFVKRFYGRCRFDCYEVTIVSSPLIISACNHYNSYKRKDQCNLYGRQEKACLFGFYD